MEDLGHGPQYAEHEEDAHERRKMGDALEDGHKDQTAYAEPEDDVALNLGELADFGGDEVLLFIKLSTQRILQDEGRHQHRYQRGDEDFSKDALSGDHSLDPQHNGGDVANGRECAS